MEHLIVEKAYRYSPKLLTGIIGYHFNHDRGLWENDQSKIAMVKCDNAPKPTSKKCDVETGEDKKGQ